MHNLIEAVTPLKGKNCSVSIEKVKEMLKKGMTLSELTNLLLNKTKKHRKSSPFTFTAEEKEAVVKALTPAKIKANIISVAANTPPCEKQSSQCFSCSTCSGKKSSFTCNKKSTRYFS